MRQTDSRTTAPHGRTNTTPAGKQSTVRGTVAAAVVGHTLLAALVFPVAVAGVAVVAAGVGLAVRAARRRDTDTPLRLLRRASADGDDRGVGDHTPCHGANC
jgi:dolichol kinase